MNRVCICVHGTFAQKAEWIEPTSKLGRCIEEIAGAKVVPFRWTGGNSQRDRLDAATQLRTLIAALHADDREAEIYLIAHSHGGNIVRYALSGFAPTYVRQCFFLGTPFIDFERRNVALYVKAGDALTTAWARALPLVLPASCMISLTEDPKTHEAGWTNNPYLIGLSVLLLFSPAVGIFGWFILEFAMYFDSARLRIANRILIREPLRQKDVIFRVNGDEATIWLRLVDRVTNGIPSFSSHLQKVSVVAARLVRFATPAALFIGLEPISSVGISILIIPLHILVMSFLIA